MCQASQISPNAPISCTFRVFPAHSPLPAWHRSQLNSSNFNTVDSFITTHLAYDIGGLGVSSMIE